MKGLSLEVIGILTIAIVSIMLLMLFVAGPLESVGKGAFCYFYKLVSDREVSYCKVESYVSPPEEICEDTVQDLAMIIAAKSILCWREAIKPTGAKDVICYTLLIKCKPGVVTEYDITQVLENGGGCGILSNSQIVDASGNLIPYVGCGDRDLIEWDVFGNVLENQEIVLIKHDITNQRIVIKA